MNLEQYSVIISVLILGLFALTVITVLAYACSKRVRTYMHSINYWHYIKAIGVLAIISTLGALTYQFTYKTPVCEYCWWQRIFMFPIDFIVLGSLYYKTKHNEMIIGALALVGGLFAAVHYYFHVQVAVLGNILSLPCSNIGIIPSCTETPVLIFGFVTIPLMALSAFVAILWLVYLAKRAS